MTDSLATKALKAKIAELTKRIKNIRSAYENIDLNAACLDPSLLFDLTESIYIDKYIPRNPDQRKGYIARLEKMEKVQDALRTRNTELQKACYKRGAEISELRERLNK